MARFPCPLLSWIQKQYTGPAYVPRPETGLRYGTERRTARKTIGKRCPIIILPDGVSVRPAIFYTDAFQETYLFKFPIISIKAVLRDLKLSGIASISFSSLFKPVRASSNELNELRLPATQ